METTEIIRIACFAIMILGWIWNRKQWGFRGPKKLIDGEGLIVLGLVGLIIAYLFQSFGQWWICLLLIVSMLIAHGFNDKEKNIMSVFEMPIGVLALVFPGHLALNLPTIGISLIILLTWRSKLNLTDKITDGIIRNSWKDSGM